MIAPSRDPVSVYTAIRGTDSLFTLAGQGGTNTINAYGGNRFDERFSDSRSNAYLVKEATDTVIAENWKRGCSWRRNSDWRRSAGSFGFGRFDPDLHFDH